MLRPSMSISRFWHYQQLMLQLQRAIWKLAPSIYVLPMHMNPSEIPGPRDEHQVQETSIRSRRRASGPRDEHQVQETSIRSKRRASGPRDEHQVQETSIRSKRRASGPRDEHQVQETSIRSKRRASVQSTS